MIGDKSYWGKSASDDAIKLVLDYVFNTLKLNKASGGCYASNIGMVFTFKKLGFVQEKEILSDDCDSLCLDSYNKRKSQRRA